MSSSARAFRAGRALGLLDGLLDDDERHTSPPLSSEEHRQLRAAMRMGALHLGSRRWVRVADGSLRCEVVIGIEYGDDGCRITTRRDREAEAQRLERRRAEARALGREWPE